MLKCSGATRFANRIAASSEDATRIALARRSDFHAGFVFGKSLSCFLTSAATVFANLGDGVTSTATASGMAIGTPAYMAPEQLAGDVTADHRVDIYAFGLLGYEMLTGHAPFTGSSPQALMAAQLTQPLIPYRTEEEAGLQLGKLAPFRDEGATTITIKNTGGTDHLSFDAVGLPGFQFIQDPLDYGSVTHHSSMDTYDHAVASDLMEASAVIAAVVYHAANSAEMLQR